MKYLVCLALAVLCAAQAFAAEQKPKPITVAAGEEFKLTLQSKPSSGNEWLLARPLDERLLKLLGSEYRRGRSGGPDAPGNQILSFRALAEGRTEIHLKYGRLWDGDVAPTLRTNFSVIITKH